MTPELLAACDEVEGLWAEQLVPHSIRALVVRQRLDYALRRALELGLIAAARRGVEERCAVCRYCECAERETEKG